MKGLTVKDPRVSALRRFAFSITLLTVLGHTVLGFEQAYATPLVGILVAYVLDLALESLDARGQRRPPKFAGGPRELADFLLPAHITGLACAMLLYANTRLGPVVFAVTVAIASKYLIRVRIGGRARHVLNPSNTGIAVTLILFSWVGISPPYHFTEWVSGPLDWIIPIAILASGTMLNGMLTKKLPLIAGWIAGFAAQAVIRTLVEGTSTTSALLLMTGTAFVLFTNYMITDPGTTPVKPLRQLGFGAATAGVYGLLVFGHVAFGLFFALVIMCSLRGAVLAVASLRPPRSAESKPVPVAPEPTPALAAASSAPALIP